MIAVYAETNFVLERALQQEQSGSCGEIIELAGAGKIAEPHDAISRRSASRSRLSNELKPQLDELGRSKPMQHVPGTFNPLTKLLIDAAQSERDGVRGTIAELLAAAEIIPLNATVLADAAGLQARFGISGQDSIVLASVLADLKLRKPGLSCFMNRNSRDFDDPDIRDSLTAEGCRFFANFDHALRFIGNQLAE